MTNPTQRAADEINDTIGWRLIEEFCEMSPAFFSKARRAFARAVFESIDVEELADVLVRDLTYSTGMDAEWNDAIARQQAQAVIDWVTKGEKLSGPERQLGADPRD